MPRINEDLLQRLINRLDLSQSQVYKLIDAKVRATHLPRHLAAIALAGERGINISKFASPDELAVMRQTAVNTAPAPVVAGDRAEGGPHAPRRDGVSRSL
jgi:hypothetical protein